MQQVIDLVIVDHHSLTSLEIFDFSRVIGGEESFSGLVQFAPDVGRNEGDTSWSRWTIIWASTCWSAIVATVSSAAIVASRSVIRTSRWGLGHKS